MINTYTSNAEPIWKEITKDLFRSELCLIFYKTIMEDGIHGYFKIFGYLEKLPKMEKSWVSTEEDPLNPPDYWCYASSLDDLVKLR